MIALSETHARRAADTANLCRELSRATPLPTVMKRGPFAISVGTDGTVFFYEFDGFATYRALFDVNPEGAVGWIDNDIHNSPQILAPKIDAYFALAFLRDPVRDDNRFDHWCSISCWLEHGPRS